MIYTHIAAGGLKLGSRLQSLEWVRTNGEEVLAYYTLPSNLTNVQEYTLHPSILDGALQAAIAFHDVTGGLRLPFVLDSLCFASIPAHQGYIHSKKVISGTLIRYSIQIRDEQGHVYVELEGLSARAIDAEVEDKVLAVPMTENLVQNAEGDELIKQSLKQDLILVASEVLKLSPASFDIQKSLSSYGFDSISFTQFANRLKQRYDFSVTPALFFEYPTIETFMAYLWNSYSHELLDYYSALNKKSVIAVKSHEPKMGQRFREAGHSKGTDVAIIGLAGKFPGSEDLASLWNHLIAQEDLITEIPSERFDWRQYQIPKWGGFLSDVDKFDPEFFSISPREAELMDPQQRLFLQIVWQAIENSGYAPEELSKHKTGLFVGASTQDYFELLCQTDNIEAHTTTGFAHSILANRVSYLLNLTGPSEAVDTACSSSIVALHRAVRAIQDGDCELAIAGGVNALLTPTLFRTFTQAGMLSPDGRCKSFDQSANGYVRGEGVGAIVLKPLHRAVEDGDTIYGVVRGIAVNHGGHVNTLTAPNPMSQAQLIVEAYEQSNIDPSTVTYIEAHGTGTSLGDPIEMNGLKRAFRDLADKKGLTLAQQYCGVGSVKANFGHLEAAAGIAGVIKVLLMLKHKQIPGQANFKHQNPYIELEKSPFYIVSKTQKWLSSTVRRAGVSSFGFGGANAHVLLEEGPDNPSVSLQSKPYYLLNALCKASYVVNSTHKRSACFFRRSFRFTPGSHRLYLKCRA